MMIVEDIGVQLGVHELDKFTKSLQSVENAVSQTAQRTVEAANAGNHFLGQYTGIQGALLVGSRRVIEAANSVSHFLGPITQFKNESTAAASSFEDAFAEVKKTVEASAEDPNLQKLEGVIRGMAQNVPFAVEEIANVASIAGQLGVPTDSIEKFSKVILDMGVTTDMTTEEAATSMARLATIMKVPTEQFENLGSSINLLGARGAATESEIVNMSLRMGALGTKVGLLPQEVLALAESLSSVGVQAELGGGVMTRMFASFDDAMKSGGKKLDALNKIMGKNFKKAWQEDASTALMDFVAGLNRMDAAGENSAAVLKEAGLKGTGFTQVISGMQQAGDKLAASFGYGAEGFENSGLLADEASKRYETFSSQMQISRNMIKDIQIEIGRALLPMMQKMNQLSLSWIQIWKKLGDQQKQWVIMAMGVATAIPPLLMGAGKLMNTLSSLAVSFTMAGKAFAIFQKGMALIGLGAAVPFLGWVAAIAAVGAAIWAVVKIMNSPSGWRGAWEDAKTSLLGFWELAKGFFFNFRENMGILGAWLLANWKNIFTDIGNILLGVLKALPGNFMVAFETIVRLQAVFNGWLLGVMTRLWNWIFSKEMTSAIVTGVGKAWTAFKEFVQTVNLAFTLMVMKMGEALNKAAPFIRSALVAIISGDTKTLGLAMVGIGGAIASQFEEELTAAGAVLTEKGKMLKNDFEQAGDDLNPMDDFGRVLGEQGQKFRTGLEDFQSSIEEAPQFNFEMGEEAIVDPLDGAAAAIGEVTAAADELAAATSEPYTVAMNIKGIEAVEAGSAEALERLDKFRASIAEPVTMTLPGAGGPGAATVAGADAGLVDFVPGELGLGFEPGVTVAGIEELEGTESTQDALGDDAHKATVEELLAQVAENTANDDSLVVEPLNL